MQLCLNRRMAASKTATLNLRIDPEIKEAARVAASLDRRSVANLIEILILDHCKQNQISSPEQRELLQENPHG